MRKIIFLLIMVSGILNAGVSSAQDDCSINPCGTPAPAGPAPTPGK